MNINYDEDRENLNSAAPVALGAVFFARRSAGLVNLVVSYPSPGLRLAHEEKPRNRVDWRGFVSCKELLPGLPVRRRAVRGADLDFDLMEHKGIQEPVL